MNPLRYGLSYQTSFLLLVYPFLHTCLLLPTSIDRTHRSTRRPRIERVMLLDERDPFVVTSNQLSLSFSRFVLRQGKKSFNCVCIHIHYYLRSLIVFFIVQKYPYTLNIIEGQLSKIIFLTHKQSHYRITSQSTKPLLKFKFATITPIKIG